MASGTNRNDGSFADTAQQWAHHSDLVMYARRVLGDRSDTAEDIVQEAYLRLLGLAASDQAPAGARPWLFRVVRNLAIDERRSAARRADPVAEPDILGTAALDDTPSLVEHREELAGALRGMAALPPRERRAIEMDQAGIGASAIATELGTTPNAVHQALFRARKRLRNARAVAWGLIPIGLAPFALRVSDPALAATLTNLPPGLPVGRTLPVAGIVAAAMVGGSVVVPVVDHAPINEKTSQLFVNRASAATAAPSPISDKSDSSDHDGVASSTIASPNPSRGSDNSDEGAAGEGKDTAGHSERGDGGGRNADRAGRTRDDSGDTATADREDRTGGGAARTGTGARHSGDEPATADTSGSSRKQESDSRPSGQSGSTPESGGTTTHADEPKDGP